MTPAHRNLLDHFLWAVGLLPMQQTVLGRLHNGLMCCSACVSC